MTGNKPIRHKPLPMSPKIFDPMPCDRCGEDACTPNSGVRYEDVDMGDYIERRDVERLCGSCMNKL